MRSLYLIESAVSNASHRAENEEAARKRALDQEDEDEEGEASRGDGKALDPTAPAFQPGAARVDDDAGGTMDVDGVATVPPNDAMEEKEEGEA